MHRRAFIQNKLWRDLAIPMLEEQGSVIHWRRLEDEEYEKELRLKLLEEAQEAATADSEEALCAELADVLECIESLCACRGIPMETIRQHQNSKKALRGGFEGRKFVSIAEHLEGSFGEKYCLADAEKYPEIKPLLK